MRLVVAVDGSWEISDRFLVTRHKMKCDVFEIKEILYYTITSTKNIELVYIWVKNGL